MKDISEMFKEEREKLVRKIEHHNDQKDMFEDLAYNQNLKIIGAKKQLNDFDLVLQKINHPL